MEQETITWYYQGQWYVLDVLHDEESLIDMIKIQAVLSFTRPTEFSSV